MPYKRKSSYKSTEYLKKNPAAGQAAIYRNPFSLAGVPPKIPDGKCYSSSGVRLQAAGSFTNYDGGTGGIMHFTIVPGITTGIYARGVNNGSGDTGLIGPTASLSFGQHLDGTIEPRDIGDTSPSVFYQTGTNAIEHWRIVSSAVKFSLTNSYDENDGWFECIRIPFGKLRTFSGSNYSWTFEPESGNLDFVGTGLPAFKDLSSSALVSHPTYMSGKLTDIHKYVFQLRGHTDDHDFVDLFHGSSDLADQGDPNPIDSLFDSSMDAIYIRVHGRVAAANSAIAATQLMAHIVSNQELMYQANSKLARFHTQTQFSAKTANMLKRGNTYGNQKAARFGP